MSTTGADIDDIADLCDRLGALIGTIDHQPLSKAVTAGLTGLRLSLSHGRDHLTAAADQTAEHWAAVSTRNKSLRRLASDLARMDPDKRREHAIDDQLEQLEDERGGWR